MKTQILITKQNLKISKCGSGRGSKQPRPEFDVFTPMLCARPVCHGFPSAFNQCCMLSDTATIPFLTQETCNSDLRLAFVTLTGPTLLRALPLWGTLVRWGYCLGNSEKTQNKNQSIYLSINSHVSVYQVPQGGFEKRIGGISNTTQQPGTVFAWPISESSLLSLERRTSELHSSSEVFSSFAVYTIFPDNFRTCQDIFLLD